MSFTPSNDPAPLREPDRVSGTFVGLYALAYTGIWLALLTPIVVPMALRVRELTPESASQNLALVLSVGALCAMLAGRCWVT